MRGRLIQFTNKLIKTTQIYYKHQQCFHCNSIISCVSSKFFFCYSIQKFYSPPAHLEPAKQNNRLSSPPPAAGLGAAAAISGLYADQFA